LEINSFTKIPGLKTYTFLLLLLTGSQGFSQTVPDTTPFNKVLDTLTFISRKPPLEIKAGKTIVNVDATVTNTGATVLEVLEKTPGLSVDKDGNVSIKGRPNAMILIDGKPTYLPPSEIASMLSSMNASQVDQIEIMTTPGAKYDAAGSTGLINIKTKRTKARGFNGTFTTSFTQGFYPKNNNNLLLNLKTGKWNFFLNANYNNLDVFTEHYALRKYYEPDEKTITGMLEQDVLFQRHLSSGNVKAGFDVAISPKTIIGGAISAQRNHVTGWTNGNSYWMDAYSKPDSSIFTASTNENQFRNIGGNLNLRHTIKKGNELSADIDYFNYNIKGIQNFNNIADNYSEIINGELPSKLKIFAAKVDHTINLDADTRIESGAKVSSINTDNRATYLNYNGTDWSTDWDKSNHFLYNEKIAAVYINAQHKSGRWDLQSGLRYENTSYDASQQDNPFRKDSSFSNKYIGFFPTVMAALEIDSNNTFSVSAGRRLDRPPYQKLNPFVFIINKYTFQSGNPYIVPQYTWNVELNHSWKEKIMTTLSYGFTKNYFSQIFYSDPSTGLITYTEGNLGQMQNIGISVSTQLQPAEWWSLTTQAGLNHKIIKGFVWDNREVSLNTLNVNINNQFRFGNGWSGEISGYYLGFEQELQEITDPSGQLGIGIAKTVLKNKGTIKVSARDLFYTQWMKGNTVFKQATEYFKLNRDTRVIAIAFTYKFGKPIKNQVRKNNGTLEELRRIGNG
jgi:hypothetical protein